jgi:hypothetical protein
LVTKIRLVIQIVVGFGIVTGSGDAELPEPPAGVKTVGAVEPGE